jgi:hypothetical protein
MVSRNWRSGLGLIRNKQGRKKKEEEEEEVSNKEERIRTTTKLTGGERGLQTQTLTRRTTKAIGRLTNTAKISTCA